MSPPDDDDYDDDDDDDDDDEPHDPFWLYRRNDMPTSRLAAIFIAPLSSKIRKRTWEYAESRGEDGFTDLELQNAMAHLLNSNLPQRTSTYRSRRNELCCIGWVIDTGITKTHPPSNREWTIWRRVELHDRPKTLPVRINEPKKRP